MAVILVAEDNAGIRDSLVAILTNQGHEVLAAENGQIALAMLQSRDDVDLLLTDVLMPEKDGVELLMDLKNLPTRPKVIVCSGGGERVAMKNLLDVCSFMADAELQKPFRMKQVLEVVNEVLAKPMQASPTEAAS